MASSLNGTGLTFSSGQTLNSPPVTSIATGNGLSGGTITTTGTITIAAPGFNTVGSYIFGYCYTASIAANATLAAGAANGQVQSAAIYSSGGSLGLSGSQNNLSGTWRYMGATATFGNPEFLGIFCRVA